MALDERRAICGRGLGNMGNTGNTGGADGGVCLSCTVDLS